MTETRRRALTILRDHAPMMAREFGIRLWGEDHPGYKRHGKCGYGVTTGTGMNLAAGGYLGRLRRDGLVEYTFLNGVNEFMLTKAGYDVLRQDTPAPTTSNGEGT